MILESDELDAAQKGVKLMRTLAYVLTGLTLLLYALAIYLARDRRRETLRAVGFAFIVVGALVLFAHGAAGDAVTSALADTPASEPPVQATWDIGTSLLKETGQSIIAYGIVIVLAAWLAGPTGIATWIRDAVAPHYRRPAVAFGVLAALLLLIFWWDPVLATHRVVPSLILIALLGARDRGAPAADRGRVPGSRHVLLVGRGRPEDRDADAGSAREPRQSR